MKNIGIKLSVLMSAFLLSGLAYGWDFTFINTSNNPMAVRLQLAGINEPQLYTVIEQGGKFTYSFAREGTEHSLDINGTKKQMFYNREGFCIKTVEAAPATKDNQNNWTATTWKELNIPVTIRCQSFNFNI